MAGLKSILLISLISLAAATRRPNLNVPFLPGMPKISAPADPPTKGNITLPPYDTFYYFENLIDHKNPSLGTFTQRYYFTEENYQPGGPIVLTTPGEGPVDGYFGYLTNRTINGRVAKDNGGAAVVLEHRFFGKSNPYPDLSTDHLAVHTLDNAIEDLVYFTQNVKLPFVTGNYTTTPDKAPWILIGGSYSGALTSWTMVHRPGIFWAGYSSSGVVEAINYFWAYFEPIREHMPSNCSADVRRVIEHMDRTFIFGSTTEKVALKTKFGMANVSHYDDVAGTLRNPLWDWQSLSPSSGPNGTFYQFCDALEVKNGVSAGSNGWGLEHALDAWATYMKKWLADNCQDKGSIDECVGTYDNSLSYWHDTATGNVWRSWVWLCCNLYGYWQDGAPRGWPSLVTRLVGPSYDERQCTYFFPEKFQSAPIPDNNLVNTQYGGWDVNLKRIFFANGERDPWREATMSSHAHHRKSTEDQPIASAEGGFHCSDLSVKNANADASVKKVQDLGVAYLTKWINQWKQEHGLEPCSAIDPASLPQPPSVDASPVPAEIQDSPPSEVDASQFADPAIQPSPSSAGSGRTPIYPNAWSKSPPTEL